MKRTILLILFLLLMPARTVPAAEPVSGGQNLLLFYSNDVIGETEPCG